MFDGLDDADLRNGAVADIERQWTIKDSNEEEIARNLPRDWSRSLTGHGLIDINNKGNAIVSKNFAKRLSTRLEAIRKKLQGRGLDK